VHLSSTDSGAKLPRDYTFTAADAGVHIFTVTLIQAGTQTIAVADVAAGFSSNLSLTVGPAAADHFSISAPVSSTAGVPFDVAVAAQDAFGNTAITYVGTVQFASTDNNPGVILPADYTFVSGDAGLHLFPAGVMLLTPGNQTVTVSDPSAGVSGAVMLN